MTTYLETFFSLSELKKEFDRLKKLDWISISTSPPKNTSNEDSSLIEFSDGKDIWEDYPEEWKKAASKGATHWRTISLPSNASTNTSKM